MDPFDPPHAATTPSSLAAPQPVASTPDLAEWLTTYFPDNDASPYPCLHCDKAFKRSDVRSKHVLTMHPGADDAGSAESEVPRYARLPVVADVRGKRRSEAMIHPHIPLSPSPFRPRLGIAASRVSRRPRRYLSSLRMGPSTRSGLSRRLRVLARTGCTLPRRLRMDP